MQQYSEPPLLHLFFQRYLILLPQLISLKNKKLNLQDRSLSAFFKESDTSPPGCNLTMLLRLSIVPSSIIVVFDKLLRISFKLIN